MYRCWFCPSCHQKKVLLFGEFIKESVAYPLPHRQYGFSLPKMLRIYSGFSVDNGKPIKRGDPAGGVVTPPVAGQAMTD
jgi:hypothetical protein